ncbi:MAG: hypothetical protein KC646_03695 [Candidatus Cloacimonetes bacterium]|nr:hypothetical protein [Candidatus Cloacimonadota bacterium]
MKTIFTILSIIFVFLQTPQAKTNEFILKTLRKELTNYRSQAAKQLNLNGKKVVNLFEKGGFHQLAPKQQISLLSTLKRSSISNNLYKDFLITASQKKISSNQFRSYPINSLNGWLWLKFAVLFEGLKRESLTDYCLQQGYETLTSLGRRFDGPTPLIQSPVLFVIKTITQHDENISNDRLIKLGKWAEKLGKNTESIGVLQSLIAKKIEKSHPKESAIFKNKGLDQQYNHIMGFVSRSGITLIDISIVLSFSMFCFYLLFNSFLRLKYIGIRYKISSNSSDSTFIKTIKNWFIPSQVFANKKELLTLFSIAFIYTVTLSICMMSISSIGVQAHLPYSLVQEDYNNLELIESFSTLKAKNEENKAIDYFLAYTYMSLSQYERAREIFLDLSHSKQFKNSSELHVNFNYVLDQLNSKSDRFKVNLDQTNQEVYQKMIHFHKKKILPPSPEMWSLLLDKHPIFSAKWCGQLVDAWTQLLIGHYDPIKAKSWFIPLIMFLMLVSPLLLLFKVQNYHLCECETPILKNEEFCSSCEENNKWNDEELLRKSKFTYQNLFNFKPLSLLAPGLSLLTKSKYQGVGIILLIVWIVTVAGSLMIYSNLPVAIGLLGKMGTPSFGSMDYLKYNVHFEPIATLWIQACSVGLISSYLVNLGFVLKKK